MNTLWYLFNLFVFTQFVACRDFYLGMFRRNDFLVAQDNLYKAPSPFGCTTAAYGRFFKCPITYFRVVDRLGQGRGPITTIVRGGLRKKYISVRIKSAYKLPVSVNIYVGCENKEPSTFRTTKRTATTTPISTDTGNDGTDGADGADGADDPKDTTRTDLSETAAESDATTVAEDGATIVDSGTSDVTGGNSEDVTTDIITTEEEEQTEPPP